MAVDKNPIEPAHPMIVALHDSLVTIYKGLRRSQHKIDGVFDEVSRQIGFVITTTVPVEIEVADGKIRSATVNAPGLKGTLFERVAETIAGESVGDGAHDGKYSVYLIWYPALKLRLRTDFIEPAHLSGGTTFGSQPQLAAGPRFVPGVREPAHWFDAGAAIAGEEAVLIAAIDEVYPELRLVERISTARLVRRGLIGAGIPEPAHLTPYVPGIREPAHFQRPDVALQFAQELAALMKRFGM